MKKYQPFSASRKAAISKVLGRMVEPRDFYSASEVDDVVSRLYDAGHKTAESILTEIRGLGYRADLPHVKLSLRAIGVKKI